MKDKVCKTCNKPWAESDFPKENAVRCKACRKIYEKEWREANKEKIRNQKRERMRDYRKNNPEYVEKARLSSKRYNRLHRERKLVYQLERQRSNKQLVNTYKTKPCADCGNCFPPYVMDFDHVRDIKLGNVSEMCNNRPVSTIITEIEKCDLVCANCHRMRTYNRYERKNTQTSNSRNP